MVIGRNQLREETISYSFALGKMKGGGTVKRKGHGEA